MLARKRERQLWCWLAALALLILWLGNGTGIDLWLADAAFDSGTSTFPWRHAWLAERFNHGIVKNGLVITGVVLIAAALWDAFRATGWSLQRRVQLRAVAISAVLVPVAVSLLKSVAASHCPWDLTRYGGDAPYVMLLEAVPVGVAPGHCMPAGHASGAMWLVSLALFLLPGRPRAAVAAFIGLLALGFSVGWLQQLRGAHFLSHTLWTMWIASAGMLVALRLADPQRRAGLLAY